MSENQLYYGSICITDLMAKLNEKHSAFTKGNNGKIYCNISVWVNPTPEDIEDMGYLKWALKEMKLTANMRTAIQKRISEFENLAR